MRHIQNLKLITILILAIGAILVSFPSNVNAGQDEEWCANGSVPNGAEASRYARLGSAPYIGIARNVCCVRSPFWRTESNRNRLPLGVAIELANEGLACLEKIVVNTDAVVRAQGIRLLEPIEIRHRGSLTFNNTWSGIPFDITSTVGDQLVLNAEFMQDAAAPSDGGVEVPADMPCVLKINTGGVRLTNIQIQNVKEGYNAVCVDGSNNILDRVKVFGMRGSGDAIRFEEGARNNWVLPTSFPQDIDDAIAIHVLNDEETHGNRFIAVNKAVGDTGTDGLAALLPDILNVDEIIVGIPSPLPDEPPVLQTMPPVALDPAKFIRTEVKTAVQIWSVNVDSTGKAIFIGGVVDTTNHAPIDCAAPLKTAIQRLQLYSINNGFLGYVTPINRTTGGGYGLINVGAGSSGRFIFKVAQNQNIIIVPELTGGSLASASMSYPAADLNEQSDAHIVCPQRASGIDVPGGTPGGNPGGGSRLGFNSVRECLQYRCSGIENCTTGIPAPPGYDSDGDGLYDNDEDKTGNCRPDAGETDWMKADTDDDGIPDGVGSERVRTGGAGDTTYNLDGDSLDNALDNDSDNDGVVDGIEDRNQYMFTTTSTTSAQGLLYRFNNVFSAIPIQKADGTGPVTCSLGSNSTIGVVYEFRYTDSTHRDPVRMTGLPEETDSSKVIDTYVCRNQSLTVRTNFNGAYDPVNMELNFRNVDTDGDRWCDGVGDRLLSRCVEPAVTHGSNAPDRCGLIPDEANEGCPTGARQLPCFDKQVFYTTNRLYVNWDGDGVPQNLRDGLPGVAANTVQADGSTAGNSVPDVFEVSGGCAAITTLCSDIDEDGIPDCVENPGGSCSGACGDDAAAGAGNPTGLRHYCADTDGDSKLDGYMGYADADVCPTEGTVGNTDGVGQVGATRSCTPETFYDITRDPRTGVVACFLDRDNDTLRDAFEDKNLNGRYDATVPGLAGIGTTESNALSQDSDSDTILDKDEVNGWGTGVTGAVRTNPSDADTDDDGMNDHAEDRDGDGSINVTLMEGRGCEESAGHDTDPTLADTDDDTLLDGNETDGGGFLPEPEFLRRILEPATWTGGGLPYSSSPLAQDSDNDGLDDNQEYNGDRITYYDANPCMPDSDGDSRRDEDECRGCRLNPSPTCVCSADGSSAGGVDTDGDGLPNDIETPTRLGTNPNLPDTDGDGVWDGIEDANHNGIYEPNLGESNPLSPDTDSDGLRDGMEVRYGTDATIADTDSDCIPDGLEDANHNGIYDPVETNALEADTDGDDLPDGQLRGIGEDMNCNGIRDVDSGGGFLETDPTNPDSDYDGQNDRDEMFSGGSFNVSNVGRANSGREGCSMMGRAGSTPSSMYYLLGLVLLATRVARRKLQGK